MIRLLKGICVFLAAAVIVSACGPTNIQSPENPQSTKCTEPRPEMCTMDYNPVCGHLTDGSFKTFSNGCNACSDSNVISYIPGECN